MPAAAKPFRILGLQQIAIGGPDKERLKALWVDMLGLTVKGNYVSERENVDEDICALGTGPTAIEVDLMQPLDPDKRPAVHTTPLNHVGLWVDDLPAAVQWMSTNGVRFAPRRHQEGRGRLRHLLHPPEGERRVPARRRGRADRARPGAAGGDRGARRPGLSLSSWGWCVSSASLRCADRRCAAEDRSTELNTQEAA